MTDKLEQVEALLAANCEGEHEFLRLMSDASLALNARGRAVLSYVVAAKLRGETYLDPREIAQAVLGRGPNFNPMHDPIVRIEMARLRYALISHYQLNPRTPVRITIALRNYIPVFEKQELPELEHAPEEEPAQCNVPTNDRGELYDKAIVVKIEFVILAIGSIFAMMAGAALAVATLTRPS